MGFCCPHIDTSLLSSKSACHRRPAPHEMQRQPDDRLDPDGQPLLQSLRCGAFPAARAAPTTRPCSSAPRMNDWYMLRTTASRVRHRSIRENSFRLMRATRVRLRASLYSTQPKPLPIVAWIDSGRKCISHNKTLRQHA